MLPQLAPIDSQYGRSRIYFIACEGYVKIGVTESPKKRFDGLQHCNPHTLQLLYLMPGDEFIEGFMHEKFRAHHHRGEWFHLHEEIVAFIEQHKTDPEAAMLAPGPHLGLG